ncbi:bifunctional methyltransferase/pyrophosphohydrolase YabN [Paratissierella segnis]|jgi:tetrapyrrole methylase family protein/MazG family protein|uniref:Nucleoside triphosphate pyrophosphohydrolase n=1 Tax=Paratissierella segnis TaxID=2763679 RepID=A0A926ETG5_9FIRM|nr:nucleoside triphosphate pyrophosphohydrolase [Paratissierella segnis]MBC8587933.1 nucleoside triphosphate pyrophosphohydrolase [Paratissierella segnis]
MGKIYIIGLGPGNEELLTLGAIERIESGRKNFLRTENHPSVKYFERHNIPYKSYDYIYDSEDEFNDVYVLIVEELKKESESEEEINYYVPGNPLVAERTVELLLEENLDIEIVSGMSFIEPMIELVGRDPINGLKIVDGAVFNSSMVDINVDLIITQTYNQRILSEVKIILSEIYGDDYNVYLVQNAGVRGKEKKLCIPIYKLDRLIETGPLLSIYVPKIDKNIKKVFDFNDIMGIMKVLRGVGGCQWDAKQTHDSIRECLIEEAYEVVDAIDNNDIDNIIEELGDLLLQVVFHCQIAYEEGEFFPIEVTSALANKLIFRHPHVFQEKKIVNSDEVVYNWNKLKYGKRDITGLIDKINNIPKLPALMTSFKVQEKAAEVGFDWDDIKGPIDKVDEEFKEVLEALEDFGGGDKRVEGEIGDLLFAVVNLSRLLDVNPEIALNRTIRKFVKRLKFMEDKSEELEIKLENMTLNEMEILYQEAKRQECL